MNSEKIKSALWGAVAGVVVATFTIFYFFAMTNGNAEQLANQRADAAIVQVLAPICAMQATQDPEAAAKLAGLKAAKSYERTTFVTDAGWATVADVKLSSAQQRRVADACGKILLEEKPA